MNKINIEKKAYISNKIGVINNINYINNKIRKKELK